MIVIASGDVAWIGYKAITTRNETAVLSIYVYAKNSYRLSMAPPLPEWQRPKTTVAMIKLSRDRLFVTSYGDYNTIKIGAPGLACTEGPYRYDLAPDYQKVEITEQFNQTGQLSAADQAAMKEENAKLGNPRAFLLNYPQERAADQWTHVAVCRLAPNQTWKTFTDKSIQFRYEGEFELHENKAHGGYNLIKVCIILDETEVSNVAFRGGDPGCQSATVDATKGGLGVQEYNYSRDLGPVEQALTISWVDEGQRDKRDLILLFIGATLGIAGAAFLELLKDFMPGDR